LEKKERVLSLKEKERVAWHEAGHAVAGWFLPHADPLLKVSIIPRGVAALGYAQVQPHEQALYTADQLNDRVCMTLAGRAAEEIVYGVVSSGARDDLERVTNYIYSQIVKFGMNPKIGPMSFRDPSETGNTEKVYSQTTAEMIDLEARRMVKEAYQRTLALLRDKREQLNAVSTRLMEREVISRDDMVELVGKRPFPERLTYEDIVQESPSTTTDADDAQAEAAPK
jgi:AFG3 family protein